MGLAAMVSKAQNSSFPHNAAEDTLGVMSSAYWNIWNDALQERIDKDIDTYRKGDASFKTGKIKRGSKVKVEQISSDFVFGASAFNWNQLGDSDADAKTKKGMFDKISNRLIFEEN